MEHKLKSRFQKTALPKRMLRKKTKTRLQDYAGIMDSVDGQTREGVEKLLATISCPRQRQTLTRNILQDLDYLLAGRSLTHTDQTLLLDEGTIHRSFSALILGIDETAIMQFIRSLPLPDVFIWVQTPQAIREQRLIQRDGSDQLLIPDDFTDKIVTEIRQNNGCPIYELETHPESAQRTLEAAIDVYQSVKYTLTERS